MIDVIPTIRDLPIKTWVDNYDLLEWACNKWNRFRSRKQLRVNFNGIVYYIEVTDDDLKWMEKHYPIISDAITDPDEPHERQIVILDKRQAKYWAVYFNNSSWTDELTIGDYLFCEVERTKKVVHVFNKII